ncbi:beta-N-acetylhexosaminidase [Aliiroseovarius sp. PTFE2010]|uniref:beta-N-acetylhexosaminidase n=1 Tax=Aliiroseovarius sp. PTFE2010 TaxID=3417190 RepID=UPI003CE6DAC0
MGVMGQGAYILGCSGLSLTPAERAFFAQSNPWGFILFARNIDTPDQVRALVSDLRDVVGWRAPVLIDQEGGRVQRLSHPHWRRYLPPLEQVEMSGDNAARSMWIRSALIADEMADLGLDVDCAPCADIAGAGTHPFLRNRCYGSDVATVVSMSQAVVDGMAARGVQPVLKHIPGHGRATADSHRELPRVSASADALRATDFAAFKALNDLPMAMTAHVVYEAFDPDRCATQSPTMVGLIRHEIGFDGLLMSDDVSMQALSGTIGARTTGSISAGCDMVLHCNGDVGEMEQVAAAAGMMSSPAQARADAVIAARPTPAPLDISALEAELQALVAG